MSLKPCLPKHEKDNKFREDSITKEQSIYRYKYDYDALKGVAMADGIPRKEKPKLKWWFKAGIVVLKLFKNRIEYVANKNIFLKLFEILFSGLKLLVSLLSTLVVNRDEEKMLEDISLKFEKKKNYEPQTDTSNYKEYFQVLSLPSIASTFQQDDSFSKMRTAGLNPVVIKKYKKIDPNFPVTNAVFTSIKGFEHDNFENALREGRLFIADYVALKDIQNGVYNSIQKYSYAPKALFALKISDKAESLQAIAIQCEQDSNDNTPLFTPNDEQAWEMAKTIVQIADFNHHELITHLSATHLLIEPFVVSTHRQLAKNHPLRILLIPHFQGTIFINYSAQKRLVNNNGPFDKLFSGTMPTNRAVVEKRLSKSFNDSMLNVDLKLREVESEKLIYPYRDDALRLWQAIEKWVSDYLNLYYKNNQDIINDKELQNWTKELVTKGNVKGFGDKASNEIKSLAYLKEATTMIIFTSSAQHSAVNFTQQAYPGFTPNMPASGYKPAPKNKQQTQKDWLELIAPIDLSDDQTDLMFTLSGVHYTTLGNYPLWYFQDKRIQEFVKKFKNNLKNIEQQIKTRNIENKDSFYTYMLPSGIPQSINI